MIKTEAYNDCQQFLALTKKNGVKAGKLYVKKPLNVASAFNVTRNLAAYRTNQEGLLELMGANVPRIDYANGFPELLVENEAKNEVLYSEDLTNVAYGLADVTVTSNAIEAPNGEMTADRINLSAGTSSKAIFQSIAIGVTTTRVYSVFAKEGTHRYIQLQIDGTNSFCNFDLQTGTAGTPNLCTADIELVNGFYRCSIYYNDDNKTVIVWAVNSLSSTLAAPTSSTGNFYLWGFQLEENYSGRATSYIPTTTVAVTRPQDNVRNDNFGYTSNQGTIFVRARLTFSESVQGIVTLSDNGVFDDYITLYYVENVGVKYITAQTYTNPDQNEFLYIAPNNGVYNMAFAYDVVTGAYSFAVNGTIVDSGIAPLAMPLGASLTRMTLGEITTLCDSRTIGYMYFDSKLDNTSLENLTAI